MKTKYLSAVLSAILLFLNCVDLLAHGADDTNEEYFQFRLDEPNGLGFGLNNGSLSMGFIFFYDHNLSGGDSQLHIQYNMNALTVESELSGYPDEKLMEMSVQRDMLYFTLRRFFSRSYGWYGGAGLGYAQTSLKYSAIWSSDFKFSSSGVFAIAEIGWQGNDNYYFHINFSPAVYISYQDNFDEDKIHEYYLSSSCNIDNPKCWWDESKNLHSLSIGFGWFF